MPSHRITTTSLQKAISDAREANARDRWEELVRLFMTSPRVDIGASPNRFSGTRS